MEKTITIDGRDVTFKSTAATPLRYKAQFGSDFFADILKMYPLTRLDLTSEDLDYEALKALDLDVFYNLLWTFAKTADKSIPDPITWLDGFDEFPLFEIIPELMDLLMRNLQASKKK